MERYGDTNTTRILNPREKCQIEAIKTKEEFDKIIEDNPKITVTELAILLNINEAYMAKVLRKYGHVDVINKYNGVSSIEMSLRNFIETFGYEIETSNRTILNGKELDIYIPELKIAFEFNDNYWHSDLFKDKKYHQNKSLECRQKGIRLIHIYEYEWKDPEIKQKLKNLISNILEKNKNKIYARNTYIKSIDVTLEKEFLNNYHLQGYTASSVKLGCFDKKTDELLGVMTFGTPRFSTDTEYEIIRLCWKSNITVLGGTEKLFNYFINKYKVNSIGTYADLNKFTGTVYTRLGFEDNGVSDPGYMWVSKEGDEVLPRYKTQKHKLLKLGLGGYGRTEDEIMKTIGYYKIYNSGNLRYTWNKK